MQPLLGYLPNTKVLPIGGKTTLIITILQMWILRSWENKKFVHGHTALSTHVCDKLFQDLVAYESLSFRVGEGVSPRTTINLKAPLKKYLRLNSVVTGSIQILAGWKSTSLTCHLGLSHMAACFIKACKLRWQ